MNNFKVFQERELRYFRSRHIEIMAGPNFNSNPDDYFLCLAMDDSDKEFDSNKRLGGRL